MDNYDFSTREGIDAGYIGDRTFNLSGSKKDLKKLKDLLDKAN